MKRKLIALSCAALLALSLTACGGSGSGGSDAEKDPLVAAQENMQNVTSMDAQMVMAMDMEIMGQSMETVTTMDMSYFSDPIRLKADMVVDAGANGTMNSQIYAQMDDSGNYTMYTFDGATWTSQNVEIADLEQYDARSNMDLYLDSGSNFKEAGTEDVNGVQAVKYTGVITGDSLSEVMKASGALDSMSTLGLDEATLNGMLDGLGDMPVSVWIDPEANYPVKYDMDMTGVMDTMMNKMLEAMGDQAQGVTMSIPKMTITMTCSNFNSASDFTIPEEALAA